MAACLLVYQPVTLRGRAAREAARVFGAWGFQLLPRAEAPPREVRAALASVLPP